LCPLACLEDGTPAAVPLHIDAVRPEVIVLASLIVAVKFLEDYQEPTRHYASNWGNGIWTCGQINVTERCIMESLGYRIMPLWDRELINDALADMDRAGRQANLDRQRFDSAVSTMSLPMRPRKIVTGFGQQLTPADTPTCEHVAWGGGGSDYSAGGASQAAIAGAPTCNLGLDPLQSTHGAKLNGFPFQSGSATPPAERL
jgi:hypothetical protein